MSIVYDVVKLAYSMLVDRARLSRMKNPSALGFTDADELQENYRHSSADCIRLFDILSLSGE